MCNRARCVTARRSGFRGYLWALDEHVFREMSCEMSTYEEILELQNDPRLWGYFIQGETAFLSENAQPERRVSNGTELVFDSLVLGGESSEMEAHEDEDGDIERDIELVRSYEQEIADAKPGSVVTLHRPPFAVNVCLPGRTPVD